MGMTVAEAVRAATRGGAEVLRRGDLGRLAPGTRADAIMLDAASPADFVYRPGVPLVREAFVAGRTVWSAADRG
jgi:imidazolonepropionase